MLSRQVTRRSMASLRSVARSMKRQPDTRSFVTIVQQGSEGWRLSLGRDPVRLAPGMHLMIPFYHAIQHVDLRERSVNIQDLTGFTSDNVPVLVSGSLFFKVRDSYHACFSVDNFSQNVSYIGTSAMRSVVGHFAYDEVISDRNAINRKLHDVIGESIDKWGVECTRFEIQNFHPSNREVEKQLELQMAAERDRRKKILDTQAMVSVAEGHKKRVILESEAEQQSAMNQAAAHKQKLIVESQGFLEAAKNEGEALARQVDILAQSIAASSENPSPEDRKKALDALLELRRLEQLKAIAAGQANTTYFFGDPNTSGRDAYSIDNQEILKKALLRQRTALSACTTSSTGSSASALS